MSEIYKHHAFISYSRRDFDEVNALLQRLMTEVPEFNYWFDLDGIESGDEFVRKIVSAIDESERILFMLSDNSISSNWAEQEVMYARNSGKRIIPILLKGAKLKGWFLFTFGNIDSIDTQDPRQVSKLISNLREWCGSTKPQSQEPIQKQVHKEDTSKQASAPSKPVKTVKKSTAAKKEVKKDVDFPTPKKINGKWGFINSNGDIVIPCIYDDVWSFSEGLSKVKKNGKWGFIDVNGCETIPLIYDSAQSYKDGKALVEKEGKYGWIDINGRTLIPFIYENASSFNRGLADVKKNGKWGYINEDGNITIPLIYDFCTTFFDNITKVKKDNKWGCIDMDGNVVIPCIYESLSAFSNGIASVKKDGKYGYINTKGTIIIPFIYDDAGIFSQGRAYVKKEGKSFYIDSSGNEIR